MLHVCFIEFVQGEQYHPAWPRRRRRLVLGHGARGHNDSRLLHIICASRRRAYTLARASEIRYAVIIELCQCLWCRIIWLIGNRQLFTCYTLWYIDAYHSHSAIIACIIGVIQLLSTCYVTSIGFVQWFVDMKSLLRARRGGDPRRTSKSTRRFLRRLPWKMSWNESSRWYTIEYIQVFVSYMHCVIDIRQ